MPTTSHGLGFGHGSIIENTDDGTIEYRATGTLLSAFRVRLADVTGVSSQRKGILKIIMQVHGQGTVLAAAEVNHGTTELVEKWFKSRIGMGATRVVSSEKNGIAEQLEKLASLHAQGLLTDGEFAAAKKKLIG